MAKLLLEVAAFSVERPASNAKAQRVLSKAALHLGYAGSVGDNEAILNFVSGKVVEWIVANARAEEERAVAVSAVNGVAADPPVWESP